MAEFWRKYGTAFKVRIPVVKASASDFAVGADWTPSAGDVKISKDGGVAANITTLPTAIAMGNGAVWEFAVSATEAQAAEITITVVDAATKAVQDQGISVATYGNASAQFPFDVSDTVRLGLTALPNVAFGAQGGLGVSCLFGAAASLSSQSGMSGTQFKGATTDDTTHANIRQGAVLLTTGGTGSWQARAVSGLTLPGGGLPPIYSVDRAWDVQPDNTTTYQVLVGGSMLVALTSAQVYAASMQTQMTENYHALHTVPTIEQLLLEIRAHLFERGISGTTSTTKQIDGSTTAHTYTLNSSSTPTSVTSAS